MLCTIRYQNTNHSTIKSWQSNLFPSYEAVTVADPYQAWAGSASK